VSGTSWQGADLLAAARQAAAQLELHADEVNALNVFPVPDGDTGSNMLATVRAAVEEALRLPVAERTADAVADALSVGALMGARGNSGVILSQYLRGFADAQRGHAEIRGPDLGRGFEQAAKAALAAVAEPVEGTMLTVARQAATAALAAAASGGSIEDVLRATVDESHAAVERTPRQLAILRQAGVVDAGGRGLEIVLSGALGYARGESVRPPVHEIKDVALPALPAEAEGDGFGYETVYLLTPVDGGRLDVVDIRNRLHELGESVLVAGGEQAAKIHVHNERPDQVIAYGLSLGSLSMVSVENLDRQVERARGVLDRRSPGREPQAPFYRRTADDLDRGGPAVVAVAAGAGLARVFEAAGAASVVQPHRGANASAGELAEAIHATGSENVIVLPNNPNVQLAARQAAELCPDVVVAIVPTRDAAQGVAALLALDPMSSLEHNEGRMAAAATFIRTLRVTAAVRDSRMGRRQVRRGQHIVLANDDQLLAADADRTRAIVSAIGRLEPDFELLTVYRGKGVDDAAAAELADVLRQRFAGVDVEAVDGGQPHYSFLISAE
jgi:uncharacterized protein